MTIAMTSLDKPQDSAVCVGGNVAIILILPALGSFAGKFA